MSAENGIYLLETPKGKGFEYRFVYLQGVEDRNWKDDDALEYHTRPQPQFEIEEARELWKSSKVYVSKFEAVKAALAFKEKIGYTEYGLVQIEIPVEF